MKVGISVYEARLRAPFVWSTGSVEVRPLIVLSLRGSDGVIGYGEAAPLGGYDGVAVGEVLAALEDCRPLLADSDGVDREPLLHACAGVAVLPQAVAAVDLALWDLAGQRAGAPVWRLLDARDPSPIAVNATITASDRAGAAAEAAAAVQAGFGTVKLKVGIGDDSGRLAAVRAAGGQRLSIRIDANGVWTVGEAAANLRALEPIRLELCEEPVAGLDEVGELAGATPVALAIDETAAAPGALDRRVCDSVCLKVARCGGITKLVDAAQRARRAGYHVYVASTLDGPLGIAAALHAAAVIAPDRPCGLATLSQFADRPDPFVPRDGRIAVPSAPGLGAGPLDWYAPTK